MSDWKQYIRDNLPPLALGPERELDMADEMAQHLEAVYEDALAGGASEQDAIKRAKAHIKDWQLLESELIRSKRPRSGHDHRVGRSILHQRDWLLGLPRFKHGEPARERNLCRALLQDLALDFQRAGHRLVVYAQFECRARYYEWERRSIDAISLCWIDISSIGLAHTD